MNGRRARINDRCAAAEAGCSGRRGRRGTFTRLAANRRSPGSSSASTRSRTAPPEPRSGQRDLGPHARPAAGRALDLQPAVERGDAVGQPAQAGAAVGPRAADAVVGHLGADGAARRATVTVARSARAYLATFVSASATTK